jgi:hypothetical protein
MKFEVRHVLAATLPEIEASFVDERYTSFLLQHHPAVQAVQVLETLLQKNCLLRRVRYVPKPAIQTIGSQQVNPRWFSFVAHSTYDFEKKVLYFANEPDNEHIRSVFTNQGEFQFSPLGNQTERVALGDISLCLPKRLRFLAPVGEYLIRREGLKILSGEIPVMERFAKEVLRAPSSP